MSLDVYLHIETHSDDPTVPALKEVYEANITHNLTGMAMEAFLYFPVWRPEYHNIFTARELIPHLEEGLASLKERPEHFRALFTPKNGYGTYESLVEFVEQYLEACRKYPDAIITADR